MIPASEVAGPINAELTRLRATVRERGLTSAPVVGEQLTLAGCVAAYVALAVLGHIAGHIAVWIPVWLAMAFLMVPLSTGAHEVTHNNLFRTRTGRLAFFLASSFIMLVPMAAYRPYHLAHHANLGTDKDPEGAAYLTSRAQYLVGSAIGGFALAATLWAAALSTFTRTPRFYITRSRDIRDCRLSALAAASGICTIAVGCATTSLFVTTWLTPWLLYITLVLFIVFIPDHLADTPDSLVEYPVTHNSRTTKTNPVMDLLMMGGNYHAAHHAWPEVPGRNLKEADALLAQLQPPFWRASSYTQVHVDAWRRLPNLAPKGQGGMRLKV